MKLEISGLHTKISDKQKKYIEKKIGGLEKYVPRNQREVAHTEVRIKEDDIKRQKLLTCEVTMHLPKETLAISETTVNALAAVDIVETKLKLALKKYKDKHADPKLRQKLTNRFRGR